MRIAVAVHAQPVGHIDVEHVLRSLVGDNRLAGVCHGFQEMILRRQIVKKLGRLGGNTGSMNIGLSMGGGNANADVLQRAAKTSHGMAFKMGQYQHGIIVGKVLTNDVLLQMEAPFHRDIHLSEFIHDIAGRHGLESMIFDGFPMLLGILTLSAVSRAALDDRAVQLMHQITDQLRMQIVMPSGFAGRNLDAYLSLQFSPQSLIDTHKALRCNLFCKINLCLRHCFTFFL